MCECCDEISYEFQSKSDRNSNKSQLKSFRSFNTKFYGLRTVAAAASVEGGLRNISDAMLMLVFAFKLRKIKKSNELRN